MSLRHAHDGAAVSHVQNRVRRHEFARQPREHRLELLKLMPRPGEVLSAGHREVRVYALDANLRFGGKGLNHLLDQERPHTVAAHARVQLQVNTGDRVRAPRGFGHDGHVSLVAQRRRDIVLNDKGSLIRGGRTHDEDRRRDARLAQLEGFLRKHHA